MHKGYANVREQVRTCPLALVYLEESSLIEYADSFLTHDTGIEIECGSVGYCLTNISKFKEIPGIISVDFDSEEKRFRIPPGIEGLICLYRICELAKKYLTLNPKSGIHYHIDFRDAFSDCIIYNAFNFVRENNDWLMNAIKSWNYTGKFNQLNFSTSKSAVRLHTGYQTIEYRIGEMSFDYEVLVKRIIHCQNMTRKLRERSLPKKSKNVVVEKTHTPIEIYARRNPRIARRIDLDAMCIINNPAVSQNSSTHYNR